MNVSQRATLLFFLVVTLTVTMLCLGGCEDSPGQGYGGTDMATDDMHIQGD